MQRIANLLAIQDGKVLLLKKPRRGWYVAPGGKMESGESIYEAAVREFREETNVTPKNAHLKGVFTIVIKDGDQVVDEWMLFTFVSHGVEGVPDKENREGTLDWHPIERSITYRWQKVIGKICYLRRKMKGFYMVHVYIQRI